MTTTDRVRYLGFRVSRNNLSWGFIVYDENWDELIRARYVGAKLHVVVCKAEKRIEDLYYE